MLSIFLYSISVVGNVGVTLESATGAVAAFTENSIKKLQQSVLIILVKP